MEQFVAWSQVSSPASAAPSKSAQSGATLLIFAANSDNRAILADRMAAATQGRSPVQSTTPLGFIQTEVELFWPLLRQHLVLSSQFPIRLRPEKEQELATQLWQPELEQGQLFMEGVSEFFQVRRTLDLMQLAAFAGIPIEDIPTVMATGWVQSGRPELWQAMGRVLQRWRQWCLERGLISYGIMTELYWQHLFPHADYRRHLRDRYWGVLADDVDEYPAIARQWFEFWLDHGAVGAFTYNPHGQVRLGQGADPEYLADLANRCDQIETLSAPAQQSLGATWGEPIVGWVKDPFAIPTLPTTVRAIQTTSRAQLLRQTAETLATAIHAGTVAPADVAILAPGLDAIARYTLTEILTKRGIPVTVLNDQRPLASSPIVRSLLTLLALVYPGLGRLLNRESIAELLVVFSQMPTTTVGQSWVDVARIDPVRAELLADHCFEPHPDHPRLLAITAFPRWDRLGYQAAQAYGEILDWLSDQVQQQQQRLLPNAVTLLDRAIQRFLWRGSYLPYEQLAALRELMETAQHYWDVESRLVQRDRASGPLSESGSPSLGSEAVAHFIQLLRGGVVTADPYPVPLADLPRRAVTLSTIYQYRFQRLNHRWQFWLDAGSARWLTGDDTRFGAPLFLRHRLLSPWTAEDSLAASEQRLWRVLLDLLGRTSEQVYLCHSDLATNGQDQTGPLLSLVNAAIAEPTLEEETQDAIFEVAIPPFA